MFTEFYEKLIRSSILCTHCMPDIMILVQAVLTWLLYDTKCQNPKRDIIQSNVHRILPKVN